MKKIIAMALMSGVLASPAWALFETNKQLASTATVTLEDAVRHALKAVPGKAVEAWRTSTPTTRRRRCMSMRRVVKRKSITRWRRACRPRRPARATRCSGGERP